MRRCFNRAKYGVKINLVRINLGVRFANVHYHHAAYFLANFRGLIREVRRVTWECDYNKLGHTAMCEYG